MADSFCPNLNLRKPEVGHANDTWGGTAGLNNDLDILDSIFQYNGLSTAGPLAGSGHPNAGVPGVGLRVGVGYTLNCEGTALFKDHSDVTKVAVLDSSLISTATTRTYSFPDQSGVLGIKNPTGTVLSGYYGGTAPAGYVFLIGRSIGDAASGATERANADTVGLFTLFWTLGFTPTGGRGASAAADFAAHKPMPLPDHRGRVMAAIDVGGSAILSPAGPSTTRGGYLGGATQAFAVGGTGSGSISGTAGTDGLSTTVVSVEPTYRGEGGGALNATSNQHKHFVFGNAAVSGSCSVTSISGATDTRSIAQPTVMVDMIIAL